MPAPPRSSTGGFHPGRDAEGLGCKRGRREHPTAPRAVAPHLPPQHQQPRVGVEQRDHGPAKGKRALSTAGRGSAPCPGTWQHPNRGWILPSQPFPPLHPQTPGSRQVGARRWLPGRAHGTRALLGALGQAHGNGLEHLPDLQPPMAQPCPAQPRCDSFMAARPWWLPPAARCVARQRGDVAHGCQTWAREPGARLAPLRHCPGAARAGSACSGRARGRGAQPARRTPRRHTPPCQSRGRGHRLGWPKRPCPRPRPTQWLEGTGSTKALLFLPHDAGGGESSRGSFQENKGTIYYFRVDIFVVVPAGGREHVQCRGFTRNDFEETQPYKGTRPRAPTLGGTQPWQPCAHSGSPQWGRCRGRRGVAG